MSLLGLLPQRYRFNLLFFAVLLGFSVGYQFQQSTVYRRDWNNQRRFFWQLAWRIPALQPDTAMVSNDMPFSFNSDNSFTAPLNWIFTPYPVSERMPYMFYYVSNRKDLGLRGLKPDTPIKQDYLAAQFYGSTNDLVGIYYYPPGCLRVLDPETDAVNATLPVLLRQVAEMSDVDRIQADAPQGIYNPPASIFGEEPQHGWCYYFQKAELARQNGDWEEVGRLGEIAFSLDDHPNDAMERLVFIEGYAHAGIGSGPWSSPARRRISLTWHTRRFVPCGGVLPVKRRLRRDWRKRSRLYRGNLGVIFGKKVVILTKDNAVPFWGGSCIRRTIRLAGARPFTPFRVTGRIMPFALHD